MEVVSILISVFIGVVGGYVFNSYVNKKRGKMRKKPPRG